MAKMIEIEHKGTGGKATVPELSLKNLWAKRGWTKVTKSTKKDPS